MKKLLFLSVIVVSIFALNCSAPEDNAKVEVQADKQLALKVDGMVCASGCAKYIEKKISKMAGVSGCTVNFEEGTANISFSSKVTGQEEIVQTITDINEGQYHVTVVGLINETNNNKSVPQVDKKEENNETKVSFELPELVTYFMSRIIR